MNSLERIEAAVRFQQTDQVPVIAQVFGHAGVQAGATLEDYVKHGLVLAECQLNAWKRYGYDAVFAITDVNVETEACGSELSYAVGRYPNVSRFVLDTVGADFSALPLPDPEAAGRMPQVLGAIRIMRREASDRAAVIGTVLGPFTLAGQLIGLEAAIYLAIDEPERFKTLLDISTKIATVYGRAQVQAGAHVVMVFDPAASPAVVPEAFFREFELPRLKTLFQQLKAEGSKANWLHIAGPVQSILPYYPEAGVSIANFDYCVSPEQAVAAQPGACLNGNIKSMAFIEETPGDIIAQAQCLMSAFGRRSGFILSSGCEIPPESRPENIAALVEAARTGSGA
jgi:uroporphyrinogen decarboxylase